MENMVLRKGQTITAVDAGAAAARAGVRVGETLLAINGEAVVDLIDYEALCAETDPVLLLTDERGVTRSLRVEKDECEPLGLGFASSLMSRVRSCRNRCLFCFIDQMPKGLRDSLSVKDDDWRLSFVMGNYVSLTNVDDAEFSRILRRRVSPLYVSVHATDPALRVRLMRNPQAGRLMERLTALRDAGLRFHAQFVLCPGLNDGEALIESLNTLKTLEPACLSIALVPVGLTRFREGLYPLRGYTAEEAAHCIDLITAFAGAWTNEYDEPLVQLSDEWYLLAGRALPPAKAYGDYPQIENGVGLLRLFEEDFLEALSRIRPRRSAFRVDMAGGTAANAFFQKLYAVLPAYGVTIELHPIENRFFGGNVHVAGLVTGSDLIEQLTGKLTSGEIFLPANMLRENDRVFLDDRTVEDVEMALSVRITSFRDGTELIERLFLQDENS